MESGWKTVAKKSVWRGCKTTVTPGSNTAKCRAQFALGGPGKGLPFPDEYDSRWPSDREEGVDDHGDGSDQFDAGVLAVEYIITTTIRLL